MSALTNPIGIDPDTARQRATGSFAGCGFSLVTAEWALTAAHCVESSAPTTLGVPMPAGGRATGGILSFNVDPERCYRHPWAYLNGAPQDNHCGHGIPPASDPTYGVQLDRRYDLALIHLLRPTTAGEGAGVPRTIALPRPVLLFNPLPDLGAWNHQAVTLISTAASAAYGARTYGANNILSVDLADPSHAFNDHFPTGITLFGDRTSLPEHGDSGGPMLWLATVNTSPYPMPWLIGVDSGINANGVRLGDGGILLVPFEAYYSPPGLAPQPVGSTPC